MIFDLVQLNFHKLDLQARLSHVKPSKGEEPLRLSERARNKSAGMIFSFVRRPRKICHLSYSINARNFVQDIF